MVVDADVGLTAAVAGMETSDAMVADIAPCGAECPKAVL